MTIRDAVCLIGNGPSLLGRNMGSVIDQFREVVRFNNCRVDGFEDDVGSKTTLWVAYQQHESGQPPCSRLLTLNTGFCPDGISDAAEIPRSVYELAERMVMDQQGPACATAARPSTGLITIIYYLEHLGVDRVFLAGIDNFSKKESRRHHYWVPKHFGQPREHDGAAEFEIIRSYALAGKIEHLIPPPDMVARKPAPPRTAKRAIRVIKGSGLKIICVLKSGGDFGPDDVRNLKRHVTEHLPIDHEFICYSDVPEIADHPLRLGMPLWWGKVEIFRETGPCIFFDLDVAMQSSITDLAEWVTQASRKMGLLEEWVPSWRAHTWNTTIIAWNGDYSYLLREFDKQFDPSYYRSDQEYISASLRRHSEPVELVNKVQSGLYSYKAHCRKGGVPADASIICFHGKPRPREVGPPFWLI